MAPKKLAINIEQTLDRHGPRTEYTRTLDGEPIKPPPPEDPTQPDGQPRKLFWTHPGLPWKAQADDDDEEEDL